MAPYLRPSSRSSWRRARTVVEALGVLVDPLDLVAQLLLDVGQLALHAPQPPGERRERRPAVERGHRVPERVGRRAFERLVRVRERVAVGDRVGEQRLLGFERDVLGGIVEPGGVDLVHLEAEQVDLAGPGAGVAAEGLRARRRARAPPPVVAVAGPSVERRRARIPVERAALHRGLEQRLVRVLAVEVDERAPTSASSPTVASRPST